MSKIKGAWRVYVMMRGGTPIRLFTDKAEADFCVNKHQMDDPKGAYSLTPVEADMIDFPAPLGVTFTADGETYIAAVADPKTGAVYTSGVEFVIQEDATAA